MEQYPEPSLSANQDRTKCLQSRGCMTTEPRYVPASLTNYVARQAYNHKNGGSAKVVILTKELRERCARKRAFIQLRVGHVTYVTWPYHIRPPFGILLVPSRPQLYTKPKRRQLQNHDSSHVNSTAVRLRTAGSESRDKSPDLAHVTSPASSRPITAPKLKSKPVSASPESLLLHNR